jgi:hypothetical protein
LFQITCCRQKKGWLRVFYIVASAQGGAKPELWICWISLFIQVASVQGGAKLKLWICWISL